MKQVRIAELKSKLSEFLRAVESGESITVLDRNRSTAQIVPIRERSELRIQIDPERSCTYYRALETVPGIERCLGKPVITGNQALMLACLKRLDIGTHLTAGGRLFMRQGLC